MRGYPKRLPRSSRSKLLREEGRISDEEFARQFDADKEELRDVLKEINATVDARNILRERATELYTSVLTKPVTRARQAFRRERETRPGKSDDGSEEDEEDSRDFEVNHQAAHGRIRTIESRIC